MVSMSKSTGNSYMASYTERAYHETNVDEILDEPATTWTKKSKHLKGAISLELKYLLEKRFFKAALLFSFDIDDNWRNAIKVVKAGMVYSHARTFAKFLERCRRASPSNPFVLLISRNTSVLLYTKVYRAKEKILYAIYDRGNVPTHHFTPHW
ncbi:hypothetical protein Hypma_007353 [Hypsizygus marmoreus]|uniref:Uncharacterized protein n=1 Tax=Hypsizygus marmoreus TaxID=39966 RepID=A0A369JVB7_HYPMA|nr:hypothetical protein Hypma_007353 [Hypsizygus marmoreus]